MKKTYVKEITYRLVTNDGNTYKKDCNPICRENDIYSMKLENDFLVFRFKRLFTSIEDARDLTDSIVRSWEIYANLSYNSDILCFQYIDALIIEDKAADKDNIVNIRCISSISMKASVSLKIERGQYPELPKTFMVNSIIEIIWRRYARYLNGKEPLLSTAYFILSYLEGLCNNRKNISTKYKIEYDILKKLGQFASTRGDYLLARKGKDNEFIPLNKIEEKWVEECIKIIIRRLGEYESNQNSLTLIKMKDLPDLA